MELDKEMDWEGVFVFESDLLSLLDEEGVCERAEDLDVDLLGEVEWEAVRVEEEVEEMEIEEEIEIVEVRV